MWCPSEFPCYEIVKLVATPATIIKLLGCIVDFFLESEFSKTFQLRDVIPVFE